MAAPHVTGTVALLLEAASHLSIDQTRRVLLAGCDPPGPDAEIERMGSGYLNTEAAMQELTNALAGDPVEFTAELAQTGEPASSPRWLQRVLECSGVPSAGLPPTAEIFDAYAAGGGAIPGLEVVGRPGAPPARRRINRDGRDGQDKGFLISDF